MGGIEGEGEVEREGGAERQGEAEGEAERQGGAEEEREGGAVRERVVLVQALEGKDLGGSDKSAISRSNSLIILLWVIMDCTIVFI